MRTLGGNDQFTTMGQVTDILYIVIMKTEKTSYAYHAILILKTAFLFKMCHIMCRFVEN